MPQIDRNLRGWRVGAGHQRARAGSEQVALARSMHKAGHGYKAIGRLLSLPVSTVRDWCTYRTRYAS